MIQMHSSIRSYAVIFFVGLKTEGQSPGKKKIGNSRQCLPKSSSILSVDTGYLFCVLSAMCCSMRSRLYHFDIHLILFRRINSTDHFGHCIRLLLIIRWFRMRWQTIEKVSSDIGLSKESIRALKKRGIFREKIHWVKAPNGRIFINPDEVQKWITGDKFSTKTHGNL